jgi:Carbohydrate family 9 binding domain-like
MSRFLCILILLLLFSAGLTLSLLGARENKKSEDKAPVEVIKKASGPITIDGVLDEPAWKVAKPIEVKYIWNDKQIGKVSQEPRMTARYTWDDNYLYIAYETFDKNLVALGSGEKKGPKDNQRDGAAISHATEKVDVVEFFISFGDTHFFWEIHHNALNQFNDIWCVVVDDKWPISKSTMNRFGIYFGTREIIQDDTEAGYTLKTAVKLKPKADGKPSTVNDSSDVDTGYIGEIRLPWYGLGAPMSCETGKTVEGKKPGDPKRTIHLPWKMAGQEMLILAVFQDGDLMDHYHHSSPTKGGGWFHKGAEHYPRYLLKD